MTQLIVSYEDAVFLGPDSVGGKGWHPGRLQRYGFQVPRGGILLAESYRLFLHESALHALCTDLANVRSDDLADRKVEESLRTLRATLEATPFSAEVEHAVGLLHMVEDGQEVTVDGSQGCITLGAVDKGSG